MSWTRLNAYGQQLERVLGWAVITAAIAIGLLLLLRAEWSLVPAEARGHILCSELLNDSANSIPLSIGNSQLRISDNELKQEMDHCEHEQTESSIPPVPVEPFLSPFEE